MGRRPSAEESSENGRRESLVGGRLSMGGESSCKNISKLLASAIRKSMGVLRWKIKRKRLQSSESASSAEKRRRWKSSSGIAAPDVKVRRQEWTSSHIK